MTDKKMKKIINEWILKEGEEDEEAPSRPRPRFHDNVADFSKARRKKNYADIRRQNQEKVSQMGPLGDMPEALEEMAHFLEGISYEIRGVKEIQASQIKTISKTLVRMAKAIKDTRGR